MAGVRLQYAIYLFTYSALLLLGHSLHDLEASRCEHVIHKSVGDTVELSSCSPTEEVSFGKWKYRGSTIEKYIDVSEKDQFKGRFNQNSQNFSLTVRRLTLQDSGDFIFVSEDKHGEQRKTVTVTLHVHEPIAKQPVLTLSSTWHTLNQSCTVLLECHATADSSVTYSSTVRGQTRSGSKLQYVIKPQDEDTKVTCTVSNAVSEMSASVTVRCSNDTQESVSSSSSLVSLIIGPVIGILLIILLLLSPFFYMKSKGPCFNRVTQSPTVNQDETPQQVYSSLLHGDGGVYETIRGSEDADGPPNEYSNVTSPSSQRSGQAECLLNE